MPLTVEQFTQRLTSSGVFSEEQLRESLAGLAADAAARTDGEALARELVKQKKLTKFQVEQIYAGKGASLTLGNYVLLDKLGEGGMGMVLKAWHRRMERTVALKVIAPKVVKEPSALKRFQREVVAAAKLTHPNIVAAYDADEAKGTHFLVMEYVEGSDLSSWVKQFGPLPVEQAIKCIIQAARGLAFAHDKGVVHRDIKPHNLLLDQSGTVKILDMGLARIEGGFGGSAEHADLTRSGAMMGTVDYMAPEQAMDSKHADARSDIYSLGCTLFYLVTGHVAFEADTVMKRLTAHQSAPPPSLVEQLRAEGRESSMSQNVAPLDSGLSTLDAIFRRMVAKKPDERPQSMLEVIAELERCLASNSATISGDSGQSPVASASSGTLLQPAMRQAGSESNASVSRTVPGSSVRTAPPHSERDVETIVSGSISSKSGAINDETVILDASTSTSRATAIPSNKSRKALLISVATVVLVLLAIFFATRGGSGTPNHVADKPKSDGTSSEPKPDKATQPSLGEGTNGTPPLAVAPFDATQAKAHQESWARHLGTTVETVNSVGAKLILIPPGEFLMGTSDEQIAAAVLDAVERERGQDVANAIRINERPQHRVLITKPFQLGATEVTVGQFRKFVEATGHQTYAEKNKTDAVPFTYLKPNYAITDESPVAVVNGDDVVAFCRWLSEKEQATYRLPTEAEWEYACRAGTTTAFSFGETLLDSHEWSIRNSDSKAQPVATKRPNPWGLFDVHGNLSEWCQDRFDETWYQQSPLNDPLNSTSGPAHVYVVRGGHFGYHCILRSAYRTPNPHNVPHPTIGFRVVREIDASAKPVVNASPDRRAAEWVLSANGQVRIREMNQKPMGDFIKDAGKLPSSTYTVLGIEFPFYKKRGPYQAVTNESLENLRGLPEVGMILLDGCGNVSDPGLKPIGTLKSLTRLGLSDTAITDAGLSELRGLSQLIDLSLERTRVSLRGLEALRDLPNLRRLSLVLSATDLTDDGVTVLTTLPALVELYLTESKITDDQLRLLARLPKLTALGLRDTPVSDVGLEHLKALPELARLDVRNTKVTAAGIAKLGSALPNCKIQWDGANIPTAAPSDVGWLEVLPLIDPRLDKLDEPGRTKMNDWQRSGNELVYRSDDFGGRLVLPVRVTGPSVEMEFEVTRTAGTSNFAIELPSANGSIPLELGREGTTVYVGSPRISIGKHSTNLGQRIRYLCKLAKRDQQDVIDVFADGISIGHWEGNRDTLAKTSPANVQHATSIGFFLAPKTDWTIHRIRVRASGGLVESSRTATTAWTDWLGPKLKQGDFFAHFDGRQGWQREGDAITTSNTISGAEVLPKTTRNGAIRVTYLLRDSKGIQINARDRNVGERRELYVAEDRGTTVSIARVQTGSPYNVLVKGDIPESIAKDAPRTLEFRVVGDTLTATFNGSVIATAKDASIPDGNFALVALKGVLVQKVEYQRLDESDARSQ